MNVLSPLAYDLGVSERTLRRAINEGTLRASRPTPRTLTVPLAERRYIRRAWPLIATLREALRTEPNVRLALLFGSTARGDDSGSSDIDLIVDLRDPRIDRVIDLSARLEDLLARPVDLVRGSDAEREPGLLADAIAEGRVLVDRDGAWPGLRRRDNALRRRAERSARAAVAA